MPAAFKIDPDLVTHLRVLGEGDAYLQYTFVDHDEEMDAEITFSFFWTGLTDDPVVVSTAEGEIPKWGFRISETDHYRALMTDELMAEFKLVCDKWIALVLPTLRGVHLSGLEIW